MHQDGTTQPARVLFFDHTAVWSGGEIALFNLVSALDQNRYHPVVLLCRDGELAEKLKDSNIECIILPMDESVLQIRKGTIGWQSVFRLISAWKVIAYIFSLKNWIIQNKFALVHTNSLKADVIGGLAARMAGVPVVWHIRDRIDCDYLPAPAVKAFRLGSKIIPRYIVANSNATLSTIQGKTGNHKSVGDNGSSRMCTVHDGLDQSLYSTNPVSTFESGGLVKIGLIGRLSPWKGQHIFIQAASLVSKKYKQVKFFIIGSALFDENQYELEIRELVKSLNLQDCVEFVGFVRDVPKCMKDLDIVVHASTTGEPFGQVIIEGMAAGKPIVATNGGGVPEIVRDGETGFLVPMNDHIAMVSALSRLIENPEMAREMGAAGYKRVRNEFSIQKTAREIELVYESLLSGKSK